VDDDVMILDTFTSVFVWIGSHANDTEKAEAVNVAQQYIEKAAAADGAWKPGLGGGGAHARRWPECPVRATAAYLLKSPGSSCRDP
jgi:hypothetical protein